MSNSDTEILELKFEGEGINPGAVKPHEIAELIIGFEKALLSTIKQNNPAIDTESLLFSFEELKNESIGLKFSPTIDATVRTVVLAGFLTVSQSFKEGDFSGLPSTAISGLKVLTKFSKKYKCTGSFRHNDETISYFTPDTEVSIDKTKWLKEETTIYGKLIDSGGENPNVHIKISDEQTIIFKVSEEEAKILATKLYDKVSVKGIAKFNPTTLEILEFKLIELSLYSPGKTLAAIRKLRNITSGFWDKFNTQDEINNQLLRD
jgi:hypothetical protein